MTPLETLVAEWRHIKTIETSAIMTRHAIEDKICLHLNVLPASEASVCAEAGNDRVTVHPKINRKVDIVEMQRIAVEAGLQDHVSTLFRFSADINTRAWRDADAAITKIFAPAITAKPGRPTFEFKEISNET